MYLFTPYQWKLKGGNLHHFVSIYFATPLCAKSGKRVFPLVACAVPFIVAGHNKPTM